jgi:hypothetical protein
MRKPACLEDACQIQAGRSVLQHGVLRNMVLAQQVFLSNAVLTIVGTVRPDQQPPRR